MGPGGSRSAFCSSSRCPDRVRSLGSVRGVAHRGHGKARTQLAWRTEGPIIATHAPRVAVTDHASGSEPTRPVWISPLHSSCACRAPGVVPAARRAWYERRCEQHILPTPSFTPRSWGRWNGPRSSFGARRSPRRYPKRAGSSRSDRRVAHSVTQRVHTLLSVFRLFGIFRFPQLHPSPGQHAKPHLDPLLTVSAPALFIPHLKLCLCELQIFDH